MSKQEFQYELEEEGCAHSWDGAGDFEVLMPLLIHTLGREEFLRRVMGVREEVLFNPSVRDAWQSSIQYITAWATERSCNLDNENWKNSIAERKETISMKVFLNSYQPLVLYRAGRQAINKYSLPPFIDYSCRKEPDFMSKYPSITALCRVDKFVPRLHEGDIAVYITSKNRYRHVAGSPDEKHWRLVAILKVLKRFETHEAAAAWYLEQGEKLPSNCMVEGNPPLPLEMTAPITEFKTDRDKWDDEYQARAGQCPVFLACTTQWMNLYDPPVMTEKIMCDILGRIRGTQTPPEITFEELIRLKRYYGI